MRTFIAILLMGAAGPAITRETGETPEEVRARLDPDEDGQLILVENEGVDLVIPEDVEGNFITIEAANFSTAQHTDLAGVERSAAGRPVDAIPGSMDAALTGMQHDLGTATVKNTVSPEPTPSKVVEEHLREDPGADEQPAPKAAQATTR